MLKLKLLLLSLLLASPLLAIELIKPIPLEFQYNKEKAKLGKKLFFDTKLSRDNTISCATCHIIELGGADGTVYSTGIDGLKGNMNSPTVLNARYNLAQMWDGSAKDLAEQSLMPIENLVEMGNTIDVVINTLKKDKLYKKEFQKIYDDGITKENLADAIEEFEKALVTPNSKFDQFLRGNKDILTQKEKEGYKLFKENGCISCHNGVNMGGNLYQKLGILKTYVDKLDSKGRFNVTKKNRDKYHFKVPTLRNISKTAPYLHDGTQKNLHDVIEFMIDYQLGVILNEQEIDKIESFLKTLDGESPKIMDLK